jgi:hypothetical protein
MHTRCQASVGYGPGVMAAIRRHPAGAGLAFLAVGCVLIFGLFLLVLRSVESDPSPGLLAAEGMAHRLLTGRESIDTDVKGSGEYVFRVVYQSSDANVGSSLFATHIGVAVCLRGDRATEAARFSYLHFKPVCRDGQLQLSPAETSVAQDRAAFGGEFLQGADQRDEPTPQRIGSP